MVHSVHLHAGRAVSYRSRWVITDAVAQRLGVDPAPGPRNNGPDIITGNIVAFGDSILAFGEGALAYELSPELNTLHRVDLAGQGRGLAIDPRRDPLTGDLHLLTAAADDGPQAHVVVAANSLTRASRSIGDPPDRIKELAITRDHVLYLADRFVGVSARHGEPHVTWITTDLETPRPVHAHDAADLVVVHTLTPSLERWTLRTASGTIEREVLDAAPCRSARTNGGALDAAPRFLWTAGRSTADKHDLLTGSRSRHTFRAGRPGDLVIVADRERPGGADAGWLLVFVDHPTATETELVILDAAEITRPPVATVRLPQPVPHGVHSTWIPSIRETPGDPHRDPERRPS